MLKIKPMVAGAVLALMVSVPAHAGLQEALNDMFLSNVTAPSAYKSQSRGGFTMGSMTARSPIRQVNITAFDPPRLNAGCGGIDMFGGSFTFINSDQLISMFRSITTNAIGALFYMAIQKIQPDLSNLMSKFQSLVHALNLGNKNTCAIANSLVKSAFDPSSETSKAVHEKGMMESISGAATNLFDAANNIFATKGGTSTTAQSGGVTVQSSSFGNLTWRALVRADQRLQMGLMFGGSSTTGKLATLEIMQSFIGTQITRDDAGTDGKGKVESYDATIASAQMFVNGLSNGQVQTILGCPANAESNEDGCNSILHKTITQANWKGVKGVVNEIMFGDASGASFAPGSLVDKVINCTSNTVGSNACGYTAQQQAFIDQTKMPVLMYMQKAQNNPAMVYSIATTMAPLVANSMALDYLNSMITVLMQIWSKAGDIKQPEQVARNIGLIRTELTAAVKEQNNEMKRLKEADDIIAMMIKNNPSIQTFGNR